MEEEDSDVRRTGEATVQITNAELSATTSTDTTHANRHAYTDF